jgi:hypothetical protein
MGDEEQVVIRVVHAISEVKAEEWDACANPPGEPRNPFVSHAFLKALEESGSATRSTGWAPYHLVIEEPGGKLAGCLPMYLKNHSRGEYVFDYGWADAFERAGGRYYPKLQVSVPFTPASGRRLLAHPGPARAHIEKQLLAGAMEVCRQLEASSIHFTFLPKEQWDELGKIGLLQRTDQQFHWTNRNYATFDDFLADLASRKRKNLKKERARALENGIEIEWVTGADLTEDHWDAFFMFYMDTGARKWGTPYLTRAFFDLAQDRLRDDVLLVLALCGGRPVAGAMNLIGRSALFGRYWGCAEDHPCLHFELCYYRAMDFAIEHGLQRVEAGAQGEHKLARGYLPRATHSLHWLRDPGFAEAVAQYLDAERAAVEEEIEILTGFGPFRKTSMEDHE